MRAYLILIYVVLALSCSSTSSTENVEEVENPEEIEVPEEKEYITYFEIKGDIEKLFDMEEFVSDSSFTLTTKFFHDNQVGFGNAPFNYTYHEVTMYVAIGGLTVYELVLNLSNEFLKEKSYEVFDFDYTSFLDIESTGKVVASLEHIKGRNQSTGNLNRAFYSSQSGTMNILEMEAGNIRGEFELKLRLSEDNTIPNFNPVDDALTIKGSFQTVLK